MQSCQVVTIVTPKKFVLNGLWFGPPKPKRVIVWVHGMFSSAFSMRGIVSLLVARDTAVLTFNNRGFETVTDVKRIVGQQRKYVRAGTAHEVFSDSSDDIEGAVRHARSSGAKAIILVGHSTGCQKSTYYLHTASRANVRGLVLLAPLSDYTDAIKNPKTRVALALARSYVQARKPHELLPASAWWHSVDAQRFLSLYTPDSVEQSIFPYFDPTRTSKVFSSLRVPILSLFAGADEYADRPGKDIATWFEEHTPQCESRVISKTGHSFRGKEKEVVRVMREWMKRMI